MGEQLGSENQGHVADAVLEVLEGVIAAAFGLLNADTAIEDQ